MGKMGGAGGGGPPHAWCHAALGEPGRSSGISGA